MYIFEFKDRFANLCLPDCPSFDDITSGPPLSSFHHVLSLSLSICCPVDQVVWWETPCWQWLRKGASLLSSCAVLVGEAVGSLKWFGGDAVEVNRENFVGVLWGVES